jgi:hypothetical protein
VWDANMGLVVVRIQPLQFFVKRKYPSVDSTGVLVAVIKEEPSEPGDVPGRALLDHHIHSNVLSPCLPTTFAP